MIRLLHPILAVAEGDEAPVGPSNVGLGSVVLLIAVAALLIWFGYLWLNSRRRRPEDTPHNMRPFLTDEALESSRLNRVLTAAVITAAVLAIVLPVYYINESNRQARAAEAISERDIEEGERWYTEFFCINCHGPAGTGGGAPHLEARSGLATSWVAPALNTVFFRYSGDEVREVIVFGRDGTPMPGNGLEGGGSMTVQEIDQLIAYLGSIQIPQQEALAATDDAVAAALNRMATGEETVTRRLAEQEALKTDMIAVPGILDTHNEALVSSGLFDAELAEAQAGHAAVLAELEAELAAEESPTMREALQGQIDALPPPRLYLDDAVSAVPTRPGDCTRESAALLGTTCEDPGTDSDRDGITDSAELILTDLAALAFNTITSTQVSSDLTESVVTKPVYDIQFDPTNGFSNVDATGSPVADLEELGGFIEAIDGDLLQLRVTDAQFDRFLEVVEVGLEFLEDSLAGQRWQVDLQEVAEAGDMTLEEAERAAGLFNAYCARCHTGGFSTGVEFERLPGSGAWAPSLRGGRAVVQFPMDEPTDEDPSGLREHIGFVIRGSEFAVNYGINGLGTGRMPGFGQLLTLEDIELIVEYERTL